MPQHAEHSRDVCNILRVLRYAGLLGACRDPQRNPELDEQRWQRRICPDPSFSTKLKQFGESRTAHLARDEVVIWTDPFQLHRIADATQA